MASFKGLCETCPWYQTSDTYQKTSLISSWWTLSRRGMTAVTSRQTETEWAGSVRFKDDTFTTKNLVEKVWNDTKMPGDVSRRVRCSARCFLLLTGLLSQRVWWTRPQWMCAKWWQSPEEGRQCGNGWASRAGVSPAGDTVIMNLWTGADLCRWHCPVMFHRRTLC